MAINIKAGVPDLFRNEEHDTQANLFKNNFYWVTIKIDNEAVAIFLVQCEWKQQLHQLKKDGVVE